MQPRGVVVNRPGGRTVNDLQKLITDRMAELDLSYRRAATSSGGRVSHATLNSIVTGKHNWRLDESTVEGIAIALDLPISRVRRAAGMAERSNTSEFVLPDKARHLSAKNRRALLYMLEALLSEQERAEVALAESGWSGVERRSEGRAAGE